MSDVISAIILSEWFSGVLRWGHVSRARSGCHVGTAQPGSSLRVIFLVPQIFRTRPMRIRPRIPFHMRAVSQDVNQIHIGPSICTIPINYESGTRNG